jgi:hypothetical protein
LARFVAIALAAALPAHFAHAQAWPAKPLRIVVAFTPGGGNDTIARLVGARLTESLGQPVVVENRPGGGSAIASELAPRRPTATRCACRSASPPSLVKNLPFDACATSRRSRALPRAALIARLAAGEIREGSRRPPRETRRDHLRLGRHRQRLALRR